jgi:hypothetical protein
MFRALSAPIIRSTIKTADAIVGTLHVSVWCGSNPLKDVQGRESTSMCHGFFFHPCPHNSTKLIPVPTKQCNVLCMHHT